MITSPNDVYKFARMTSQVCREHGYDDVAQQLDDAMHLGSSGLEILGAISATLTAQSAKLEQIVDRSKLQEVARYVNKAFGRE